MSVRSNVYQLRRDEQVILEVEASHMESAMDHIIELGYDVFQDLTLKIIPVKKNYSEDDWDNWHPSFF
jgi:hypothetical protein